MHASTCATRGKRQGKAWGTLGIGCCKYGASRICIAIMLKRMSSPTCRVSGCPLASAQGTEAA
eukprot:223305-Pelagomonas_calceolata.AAC.3